MYGFHTYTMNSNIDERSKKLLDRCFYENTDNVEPLKTMLAHKANPNIQDTDGYTPLHFATSSNIYPEYISILINAGAKPNERTNKGYSSLHLAVNPGNLSSIQLLLHAKADPNLADNYKNTPLHHAIFHNVNVQALELLLSAHANPNLKNHWGCTPLHTGVGVYYFNLIKLMPELINPMQLLLQYGSQVDIVDNRQLTPLQLLATNYQFLATNYYDCNHYSLKIGFIARKMGRLLVWYQYILLPHFIKHLPEKAHACAIASYVALICAEQPTIWS